MALQSRCERTKSYSASSLLGSGTTEYVCLSALGVACVSRCVRARAAVCVVNRGARERGAGADRVRRARAHLVHGEVLGALLGEREAREGAHRARLRRREEQGLALRRARKVRHDGVELAREAEVEQPIGLVEHERAQRSRLEVRGLLEVLQQPPGSGDDERHARDARLLLDEVTLAAGEQRRGERVPRAHLAQDLEDLERELARRRDDERAEPVARGPALAVESLEHRHEERERFARARARGAEHVAPDERVRDARGLDRRRRREASRLEPGLGARRERHLLEEWEGRARLRARRRRLGRAPPLELFDLAVLVERRGDRPSALPLGGDRHRR